MSDPGPATPRTRADQPAIIMAGSGETVTLSRTRGAQQPARASPARASGLKRLDHYAVFMENHPRFIECGAAGERSGLYYTYVNSFLTAGELAYHRQQQPVEGAHHVRRRKRDSRARRAARLPARRALPDRRWARRRRRASAISTRRRPTFPRRRSPTRRSARRCSIPRARPAGRRACLRPLPDQPPAEAAAGARRGLREFLAVSRGPSLSHRRRRSITRRRWPASAATIRAAGRSIVMERFDPEQFLALDRAAIASPTPSSCRRCSRGC